MSLEITNEDNMALMARYPDKYFELAIVDPPYGIGINMENMGRRAGEVKKYDGKAWDNSTPTTEYFDELFRVSRNQIIWGGNCFTLPVRYGWIVWNKDISGDVPFSQAELAWSSFDCAVSVFNLRVQTIGEKRIHPTQKPIALYKWLLSRYAKPGDKIIDTHLGSGSIAIACHDLGFDLTACELDKDYFEAAMKRIKTHQAQGSLFEIKELQPKQLEVAL
jgi:site-specific DNA-methyltransferase (adenine-specific)